MGCTWVVLLGPEGVQFIWNLMPALMIKVEDAYKKDVWPRVAAPAGSLIYG